MTKQELISKGKAKVRGNSDLMLIYINLFRDQFGYKPNCAGCTFDSDWRKFTADHPVHYRGEKKRIDAEKTFKLKSAGTEILRFTAHGKLYRKYSNRITEQFAINFLTYGSESEIEERKKMFSVLPEKLR